MPRAKKCDVCGKAARGGRQVGTMYACRQCLELAENALWESLTPEQDLKTSQLAGLMMKEEPEADEDEYGHGAESIPSRLDRDPAAIVEFASPKPSLASRLKGGDNAAPHLIIEARAGTGKTTTLIEGLKTLRGLEVKIDPSPQQARVWEELCRSGSHESVCFVAFNKSIATELQNRVPLGCNAMTMHSMGFKAVQQTFGRVQVNNYRISDIISELTGRDLRELRKTDMEMIKATEQLVGLCKMNLTGWLDLKMTTPAMIPTLEELMDLASYYDVDLNGNSSKVFNLVPKVLERCKEVNRDRCIDFNDMIWLPVALDLAVTRYDVLLVDEAQDLNRCQQQLALKAGRRLVLCGDPRQAIYGFAGADAESMSRMQATLEATDRGCVHLPLTVTRRCGKAIVEEARKIVPDFDYWETNPDGLVSEALYKETKAGANDSYTVRVEDGDMLLCRVNAPLVSQCFRFLKAGRKAMIQGRDVGQGLISTIKKMKAEDVGDLGAKLSDWLHVEVQKESRKRNPNENKLIALQDRVDCLYCFMEDCTTVQQVIDKIEAVFTDDRDTVGIKLSSVHKAKGLEAKRVFLLRPEGASIPHPMAKSKWAREQEYNILYVAVTRAIEELVYVS